MARKPLLYATFLLACLILAAGCASKKTSEPAAGERDEAFLATENGSEDELFVDPFDEAPPVDHSKDEKADIADPIEGFNRAIFTFNDKFYFYVAKPVAKGWRAVAPESVRVGLGNVLYNILAPVRLVNNILQLDFMGAAGEVTRFAANSTVGLFGWFDLAAENGLKPDDEDLGQTFGRYGVGHGFYLVLPFLGPTSLRDATGDVFDSFLHPFAYTLEGDPTLEMAAFKAVKIENTLSLDKDTYENVVKEQIDPYLFMRNAYYQIRESSLKR